MRLNPKFKLNMVAGEYMLLDTTATTINLNKVFSINEPAAWLWRTIGGQEFDEPMLVEWVCAEYDVPASVAEQDVHSMVCLWRQYDMLIE